MGLNRDAGRLDCHGTRVAGAGNGQGDGGDLLGAGGVGGEDGREESGYDGNLSEHGCTSGGEAANIGLFFAFGVCYIIGAGQQL